MASITKTPLSKRESSESEESSWTKYFEDFLDNNNHNNNIDQHNNNKCSSISFSANEFNSSSSSLVSDAASFAAPKYCIESSFNKRKKIKTAAFVDHDALEDTATSPVNSPKVLYENQLCKQKEEMEFFQEKGNSSGEDQVGFNERGSDFTELKKKGLRLVPLSMVVKYLG